MHSVGIFIMNKIENWKEVIGFNKKYLISDLGRVRSVSRIAGNGKGYLIKEKILKYTYSVDKYPMISLSMCNRKKITKKIHILVAIHFLGEKPNENSFVCHKDDNKNNNNVKNLYWGDLKSNVLDRYKNGKTKFDIKTILNIRNEYSNGITQKELTIKYNCNSSYISRLVNNKRNIYF